MLCFLNHQNSTAHIWHLFSHFPLKKSPICPVSSSVVTLSFCLVSHRNLMHLDGWPGKPTLLWRPHEAVWLLFMLVFSKISPPNSLKLPFTLLNETKCVKCNESRWWFHQTKHCTVAQQMQWKAKWKSQAGRSMEEVALKAEPANQQRATTKDRRFPKLVLKETKTSQ